MGLSVTLPTARWTETSDWPRVRAQSCRQCIDFTAFTDISTSFTELNSTPLGEPGENKYRPHMNTQQVLVQQSGFRWHKNTATLVNVHLKFHIRTMIQTAACYYKVSFTILHRLQYFAGNGVNNVLYIYIYTQWQKLQPPSCCSQHLSVVRKRLCKDAWGAAFGRVILKTFSDVQTDLGKVWCTSLNPPQDVTICALVPLTVCSA